MSTPVFTHKLSDDNQVFTSTTILPDGTVASVETFWADTDNTENSRDRDMFTVVSVHEKRLLEIYEQALTGVTPSTPKHSFVKRRKLPFRLGYIWYGYIAGAEYDEASVVVGSLGFVADIVDNRVKLGTLKVVKKNGFKIGMGGAHKAMWVGYSKK